MQIFVVAEFAVLPWLALAVSYALAGILALFRVRDPLFLGHWTAAPLVILLAYFFLVNTTQYLS